METERFEELVKRALESLPEEFLEQMQNIDVMVADYPTPAQLRGSGIKSGYTLLGLYEGIPQTKRNRGYNMVLPDKITIFQKSIENTCRSNDEIVAEVGRVVRHEIAHHFGISDERLKELGQ